MRAGDIVGSRFELQCLAGSGGMGDVFRAYDRITEHVVAIKVLHPGRTAAAGRFFREARVLAGLNHPAIVRYITHGESPQPFLAMEWLDGEDLATRLARAPLTQRQSLALARRVAEALGVAHARGVVHRDIKPSNIFLPGGSIEQAKVLDFGVARVLDATRAVTATGEVLGTLRYMAPEQAGAQRELDARADVFSLGCVMFECLTGRPAFEGESVMAVLANVLLERAPRVRRFVPDAPEKIDDLVFRMMSREPHERLPNGAAVASALAPFLEGEAGYGDARGGAGAPVMLSHAERKLTAVVLSARPTALGRDTAQTLSAEAALRQSREASAAVLAFSGRMEHLAEDVSAVVLHARDTARDLAAQAARCALALRAALPTYAMVLATAPGEARTEGVPTGEVVERASSLLRSAAAQAAGDDRDLYVQLDATTAALLDDRFEVLERDAEYLLCSERADAEPVRTIAGRVPPFVGRERELGTLASLFDECAGEPRACAVLVTGPPGIGKSRLRLEFARSLEGGGSARAAVFSARAVPNDAAVPFALLGRMLRALAGVTEFDPREVQRAALVARVAQSVPAADAARVTEFLGALAGVPFPDEDRPLLRVARRDAALMAEQTRRAWDDFVTAECGARPVVLSLDDVQWADAESLQYVDAALRARDRALMVMAAARPEVYERFPRLWAERRAHEVRLGELPRRASEKLVAQVLPEGTDARAVATLVERAAGVPRALEDLLRAASEDRVEGTLPDAIVAEAQVSLERLEAPARRFLRAASLFGQTFWLSAAASVLAVEPETLQPLADALCARDVLARPRTAGRFPEEREYAFRTDVLHRAAYAGLTERDRRAGHRLAADWLEARGERDAIVLAEHMARGDEPGRAVVWYLWAAEQAFESHALSLVGARAERGVACGASGPVLGELRLLQAEALGWRGANPPAVAAVAREALALLVDGTPAWCRAAAELLIASARAGEREQARLAASALASLDPEENLGPGHCAALARAVAELAFAGEIDAAASVLARLEVFSPGADPEDRAVQTRFAAWAAAASELYAGDPAASLARGEDLAREFESAGQSRFAVRAWVDVALAYCMAERWSDAVRCSDHALAACETLSLAVPADRASAIRGYALAHTDANADALAVLEGAVEHLAARGDRLGEGMARWMRAAVLAIRGDADAAGRAARATSEDELFAPWVRSQAAAVLSRVALSEAQSIARAAGRVAGK